MNAVLLLAMLLTINPVVESEQSKKPHFQSVCEAVLLSFERLVDLY